MATFRGCEGALKVDGTALAELKSFSIDYTINTIDTSTMGNCSKQYAPSFKEWSGSADIFYNVADAAEVTGAITAQDAGTSAALLAYMAGATPSSGDPEISGDIIITGFSINATYENLVEASISFQGDGALSISTYTP